MDDNDKKSQSETQKDHGGLCREEFDKMKSDRKAIDRMYSHLKRYPGKPVPVSKPVAVVCAVSMITGFILICTGFFFHDSNSELEEILLMIGLVLAAGVSTVCYVIDRLLPKHLSEDEQELLLLRYANDVPVADICKIIGISRFALYRRLNNTVKKLRAELMKGGYEI